MLIVQSGIEFEIDRYLIDPRVTTGFKISTVSWSFHELQVSIADQCCGRSVVADRHMVRRR